MGAKPSFLLLTELCCHPDRTRPVVPTIEHARRDRTHYRVWSSSTGRVRSQLRRSGTSLYSTGLYCPTSVRFAFLASGRCYCRASDRSVRSLCYQRPVYRLVTSVSSFLRDLVFGLVPIFVLGLCLISWVFSCASRVLLKVLITSPSSKSHLAPY